MIKIFSNGQEITQQEYLDASASSATTESPDAKKVSSAAKESPGAETAPPATQKWDLPSKKKIMQIILKILDPLSAKRK